MPVYVTFTPPAVLSDDTYLLDIDWTAGGTSAGVANTAAIQAALDALPARSNGEEATLLVPPGTWRIADGVWGQMSNVNVVGYGKYKSVLQLEPTNEGSAFYVGMPRSPTPNANHWVDSFGVLDSGAAPTANVRWGIDLNADSHIAFPASSGFSAALGDYWGTTGKLTVEFAVWGVPPDGPIIGASWNLPDPWILRVVAGSLHMSYTIDPTATMVQGTRCNIAFGSLSSLSAGQLNHIAIQVNLDGVGVPWTMWLNKIQKTTPSAPAALGITTPGLFRASTGSPFKIGAAAGDAPSYSGDYYSTNTLMALRLHGLRVSAGLRYADNGLNSPMARLDAATITHSNTYFAADSITCGYLAMNQSPAACQPTRRVAVRTQSGTVGGMLLEPAQYAVNPTSGWTFRDLTITTSAKGEAVTTGLVLNIEADRVKFGGGRRGFSTWKWGVTYPIRLSNCIFEGTDAPIYLYYATQVVIENASFPSAGRCLAFVAASVLKAYDWFFTFGTPKALMVGQKGSTILCCGMGADIEGSDGPTVAPFVMESGNAVNGGMDSGGLSLRDFVGGSFKAGTPFLRLLDGINSPGNPRPARLDVSGQFVLHSTHTVFAETSTETGWEGNVNIRAPWSGYTLANGPGAAAIVALP